MNMLCGFGLTQNQIVSKYRSRFRRTRCMKLTYVIDLGRGRTAAQYPETARHTKGGRGSKLHLVLAKLLSMPTTLASDP